jgi:hypothetical protein
MGDSVLYRVRFRPVAQAAPGGQARLLMHFDHPRPTDVLVETLPGDSFPKAAQTPAPQEETLLLFLPGDAADREARLREAEAWMNGLGQGELDPPLRADVEGACVLWRLGRAAVLAPPDRRADMLAAMADFAFHHGELGRLEAEVSSNWERMQEDLPLLNKVGRKGLRRRKHVETMTLLTAGWRLRCARLEGGLADPSARLLPAGRQAGEKLRTLARVEDRLERLDGQIEVYEHEYEQINLQLGEYRRFRKEMIAWILVLIWLAFDITVGLTELYLSHFAPEGG